MESEKPTKDLVVDVSSSEVQIALMENHRLIEYNKESSKGAHFTVGDVYLGKVKKILPALNAAFVDIGDQKEAFVHYLDLGLYFDAFDRFVRESNQNTPMKDLYSASRSAMSCPRRARSETSSSPARWWSSRSSRSRSPRRDHD